MVAGAIVPVDDGAGARGDDAPESARHPDNLARYATIGSFLISIPVAFVTPWAYTIGAAGPAAAARLIRSRNSARIDQ